jgi:hypothetical protein
MGDVEYNGNALGVIVLRVAKEGLVSLDGIGVRRILL